MQLKELEIMLQPSSINQNQLSPAMLVYVMIVLQINKSKHFQNEIENDASCKETEIQRNTSYNPSTIEFIFICR